MRTATEPERLGIFGGTFDPVHIGHLVAALEARHQLALDRVLFVVAREPWQKHGTVVAPAEARFAMVQAAVAGVEGFEASTIELTRGGPSFTIDTVEQLAADDRHLFLIVGTDAAAGLDTWERAADLRRAVTIAVMDRATDIAPAPLPGWDHRFVSMPRIDVSSTAIRERIAVGGPIEILVPDAAIRVIRERHLYTPAG
ncbi:MAG: nicotinate-nucleotide adenylyltransferase [Acidimicrobiia bacterium]